MPDMPLLQQVHEVGADGSVCATPVAWRSLAQRGYFYVHVRDTSVPGTPLLCVELHVFSSVRRMLRSRSFMLSCATGDHVLVIELDHFPLQRQL
ncbi:MAG: hypothetical protein EOO65_05340 [Methanosarcinales archaeon]|nr:MAG: hypothetical protein EOO65_05340 [Methanosarcinales archaeon]